MRSVGVIGRPLVPQGFSHSTGLKPNPVKSCLCRRFRQQGGPSCRQGSIQTDETVPLKLTAAQRKALIHGSRLKAAIRRKISDAGADVVLLTRKELDHLHEEAGTAAVFVPEPYKRNLVAVQRKVLDLLDAIADDRPRRRRRRPRGESDLLFDFTISLPDTKPTIWRHIQVEDCTLARFHRYVQAAFGWQNLHLHQFEINGLRYGPALGKGYDGDIENEAKVRLSDLLPKSGQRTEWVYEYDMLAGWQHKIVFEGYPPKEKRRKYPLCVDGERACPPEDIGGAAGYKEYLAVLANPKHEWHEELMRLQGPFDPEAFDADNATKAMRKVRS